MADPSPYAVFTETRQFALDTARRIASDLPGRSNPSSILWSRDSWHTLDLTNQNHFSFLWFAFPCTLVFSAYSGYPRIASVLHSVFSFFTYFVNSNDAHYSFSCPLFTTRFNKHIFCDIFMKQQYLGQGTETLLTSHVSSEHLLFSLWRK